MLDELINNYKVKFLQLNHMFEQIQSTHIIPNAEVEGAPKTVDEALYGVASMLFALDQIIHDLTILQMERDFAESDTEEK